jgi:catechol 2,3-dioxygenase-like lactoylglutathione lyase family enzyme
MRGRSRAPHTEPQAVIDLNDRVRLMMDVQRSPSKIPTPPEIRCEKYHAILAVTDIRAAVDFYTTKLGFWLAFAEGDPPTFAGVNLGGANLGSVQVFLQSGTPSPKGCSLYFVVDDADDLHRFHETSGVEILEKPGDRPYGLRDYTVQDHSGYRLTFGHHPKHRAAHRGDNP